MTPDNVKMGRLIALFFLALAMFDYPLLSLFNREALRFGVPLLYLYLFLAWLGFIGLIALSSQPTGKRSRSGDRR
jgi:hypothetical protein